METHFTWKTNLFSNRHEILRQEFRVGELQKLSLTGKIEGEMKGHRIMFHTSGVFRYTTRVIDLHNEQELGLIRYAGLKKKPVLYYRGKEYYCSFGNMTKTRWVLEDGNGPLVRYMSNGFSGAIFSCTHDEVLILAGFFIRNLLKQMTLSFSMLAFNR